MENSRDQVEPRNQQQPSPELQEWLSRRTTALNAYSTMQAQQGISLNLRRSTVDPNYLSEPLRSEAIEYLARIESLNKS